MYGHIRETTGRPPPASSPHRPDAVGVSTSAECLSTGLSATLSRKPNRRGATPSTRRGWWLQGALAAARRPTLVYPGLPQDLSPSSCHGRTLWSESAAGELLDSSTAAGPPRGSRRSRRSSRAECRTLCPGSSRLRNGTMPDHRRHRTRGSGRKARKNRPCTTPARRRRTPTRTSSS
jgi:hypothetical protein